MSSSSIIPRGNANPQILTSEIVSTERLDGEVTSHPIYEGPAPGPFDVTVTQLLRHTVLQLNPDGGTVAERVVTLPEAADIVGALKNPRVGLLKEVVIRNSGDMFWVAIERDGPSDSFTGDVAVVQMQGDYVAWSEGGTISSF